VSLEKCIFLAPVALLGAGAGFKFIKRVPEKAFFTVVEIVLFLVSIKLIWDAVRGFTV
jgi:uncharacterized protein